MTFTGRSQAEALYGRSHWAVISITQPGEKVDLRSGWHSVLRLHFHDIDQPEDPYTLFDESHAKQIIDFVSAVNDSGQVEGILVHCQAGISRSAAVARWIADQCELPFPDGYSLYNKYVYRVLRLASGCAGTRTADEVIRKLNALQPEPDIGGISPGFTDKATAHEAADQLLLEVLRAAGQREVADAYEAARERFDGWWFG